MRVLGHEIAAVMLPRRKNMEKNRKLRERAIPIKQSVVTAVATIIVGRV